MQFLVRLKTVESIQVILKNKYSNMLSATKYLHEVENPWESHGKPKGKTKRAAATIYAVCDVK